VNPVAQVAVTPTRQVAAHGQREAKKTQIEEDKYQQKPDSSQNQSATFH